MQRDSFVDDAASQDHQKGNNWGQDGKEFVI